MTWIVLVSLVGKENLVSPKLSLKEKSPPRYAKVLAMSRTLVLIDGISLFCFGRQSSVVLVRSIQLGTCIAIATL